MDKIHLIGNAHLDPAWLWRWQEGFSEVLATFRSALDRMKEFDDFKFTSACSAYYMWVEKCDKEMFEEIKQRVKEGRWNIVGGWLIQPDCNIPSGESFARHGLISQRYFKEKFGVTATVGYNVDSFGHNGSIPKILRNSGMDSYVFMRPMPEEKTLPKSLFEWQSKDGSRVTTFRLPQSYSINEQGFDTFTDVDKMNEGTPLMAFYGVGNHGGGPTIKLLERMHEELGENFVYSTPEEYFAEAKKVEGLPIIEDDLQYHATGCYSAHTEIKSNNRLAENMLVEAEKYSALSNHLLGTEYPAEDFKKGWENVLFNQFHDIMGGCSIPEVFTDARWSHGESLNIASKASNYALKQLAWNIDTTRGQDLKCVKFELLWKNVCADGLGLPVVIFNPLPFPVERMVQLTKKVKAIKTEDGEDVAIQQTRAPQTWWYEMHSTAFIAKVPALGYTVYRIQPEECKKEFNNPFTCTENSIDNGKIKLTINPDSGEISSILLKESGKELLSADTRTVFIDESDADTWAHGIKEFKDVCGVCEKGSVHLIESGPIRATLRTETKLFDTEIIRDYSIEQGSDIITVKTKVDFHEKHKMLKLAFPVKAESPKAYTKIPYSFIERPLDGTEQVCGDWLVMCGTDGGLVVSNRDKYSFSAENGELLMTIMRGTIYADHCQNNTALHDEFCEYIDQGIHQFTYSISPFQSFARAEKDSQLLASPLTSILDTFHKGSLDTTYSGISISEENIAVTALKKHEDSDGWILRCYETEDKETDVKISLFGTEWESHFTHNQVKTFLIKDGKVTETDFIECTRS